MYRWFVIVPTQWNGEIKKKYTEGKGGVNFTTGEIVDEKSIMIKFSIS